MIFKRFSRWGLLLACLHLLFVYCVYKQQYEGSWAAVVLMFPDLPVMAGIALLIVVFDIQNWWGFVFVLGTAWWYWLGMAFEKFILRKATQN